jgi:nicotinate-nucleotide adenylyltransferase
MASAEIPRTSLSRMTRVGVFGGTFDPVHFGHLHLALTLFERHALDRVLFIPSAKNPLKTENPASDQDRLTMLHFALEELPRFSIDEREMKRGGKSFTVDTLRSLREELPDATELFLLLGEDVLSQFHDWREPEAVLKLATPLIVARSSSQFPKLPLLAEPIKKRLQEGWTPAPLMEISATEIRKRLKLNQFCGHLLPAKVLDHIHRHRLYFSREKGAT